MLLLLPPCSLLVTKKHYHHRRRRRHGDALEPWWGPPLLIVKPMWPQNYVNQSVSQPVSHTVNRPFLLTATACWCSVSSSYLACSIYTLKRAPCAYVGRQFRLLAPCQSSRLLELLGGSSGRTEWSWPCALWAGKQAGWWAPFRALLWLLLCSTNFLPSIIRTSLLALVVLLVWVKQASSF